MRKRVIACDLDGTLATHTEWVDVSFVGAPVPIVLAKVKSALAAGHEVWIFTARVAGDHKDRHPDPEAAKKYIEAWCLEHVGQVLPVTATKFGFFDEFWDDKGMRIEKNEGRPTSWAPLWISLKTDAVCRCPCHEAGSVHWGADRWCKCCPEPGKRITTEPEVVAPVAEEPVAATKEESIAETNTPTNQES